MFNLNITDFFDVTDHTFYVTFPNYRPIFNIFFSSYFNFYTVIFDTFYFESLFFIVL